MCDKPARAVKVSVLMITYNQEKYIAQALDSVLMQEVDFEYEIIIGEDCSTDGTREIVVDYQQRHPDKISLLLPEKNLGMMQNFIQTYHACTGEYIAILEGDDFWTCSTKLQTQVNFLDSHPESAISFHTTKVFFEDDSAPEYLFPLNHRETSSLEELLEHNFIQTCSVVFRNRLFGDFPEWFFTCIVGDYPLHIFNAEHGNIGFIKDVMAAYRIHSGGVWSMQMQKNFVRNMTGWQLMYANLDQYFEKKYHSILKKKVYECELALYKWHLRKKNYKTAIKHATTLVTKYSFLLIAGKLKYEMGKLSTLRKIE
jgi:glycosyltransferase involved in cell wall biosynthesis